MYIKETIKNAMISYDETWNAFILYRLYKGETNKYQGVARLLQIINNQIPLSEYIEVNSDGCDYIKINKGTLTVKNGLVHIMDASISVYCL
jgi:hypothetical protein